MRWLLLLWGCGGFSGPPPHERQIFTTSSTHDGGFGGLAQADRFCSDVRSGYVAWLSNSTDGALSRVPGTGPWLRGDGKVVFADRAALAGGPALPLDLDEKGATLPLGSRVWTATSVGGTPSSTMLESTCEDWFSGTQGLARTGLADATDGHWTDDTDQFCQHTFHLYCFEP